MPVIDAPVSVPSFTLAVANTLYATENGLGWLGLEDGTDLLTDSLISVYATEDAASWLLTEADDDISTETDLGLTTDLTPYLQYGTVSLKFNTLDFTLIDPPLAPLPVTAAVTTTNPAWSGNVASANSFDPTTRLGHVFWGATATNTATLPADLAPFDLSETAADSTFRYLLEDGSGYIAEETGTDFAPGVLRMEGSLAYAYANLSVRTSLASSGPDQKLGRCVVYQPGLRPGNTFYLSSTNQGYSSAAFQVNQATVTWPVGQPIYVLEFGDTPQTLALWTQVSAPAPVPTSSPSTTVPSGPVIYGRATAGHIVWPIGGGIVTVASATFTVAAGGGHANTCQVLGAIDCRAYAWDNYVATPRRAVRAILSGAIYTGAWQETPLGTATSAGARATYDVSSSTGIALPDGTYTVSLQIDTVEFNQMEVFGGWVQVAVTTS